MGSGVLQTVVLRSRKSPLTFSSKHADPPNPPSLTRTLILGGPSVPASPSQPHQEAGGRLHSSAKALSSRDGTQKRASQAAQSSTPGRSCLPPTCCSCRSALRSCPRGCSGARRVPSPPRLARGLGDTERGEAGGRSARTAPGPGLGWSGGPAANPGGGLGALPNPRLPRPSVGHGGGLPLPSRAQLPPLNPSLLETGGFREGGAHISAGFVGKMTETGPGMRVCLSGKGKQ